MQKITNSSELNTLQNNNRFIGSLPEMKNSSITFSGKGNVLFCENGVKLTNTSINFNADGSIVCLCENKYDYKLNLTVYNNNIFYSGKNNYFNGVLNVILSEQKHFFMGNNCLISFGIWVRNADPHLIYDIDSKDRINPTKSIFIGDHVWLGQSVMILKGTEIESGSVIGGMSVVSGKKIQNNSLWAGNPVRQIKENIFWDAECVHAWTQEKTKKSKHKNDKTFIYKYKSKECIPFNEIDKKMDADNSVEDKLEELIKISSNTDKNRFVCPHENLDTHDSSGLLSKLKYHLK